ncbi:MAG: hypothetical protein AAF078_05175 [Planctomycetota bacterium]
MIDIGQRACLHGGWPVVSLDEQLCAYFGSDQCFAGLKVLIACDPYADTEISVDDCANLISHIDLIMPLVDRRELPAPPKTYSDDEEPFGWEGLGRFLLTLREICHRATSQNKAIVAAGD